MENEFSVVIREQKYFSKGCRDYKKVEKNVALHNTDIGKWKLHGNVT